MNTISQSYSTTELTSANSSPVAATKLLLVSVVVPVYNGSKYIQKAIESVLSQTYKNYEIIVIDDGSTDDTRQKLHVYHEHIRYVFQQNRGSAAARNLGINLAKGELIAFLDSDDFWTMPEKLEKQVACFQANPDLGGINTGWRIVDGEGKHIKTVQPWHKAPNLDLETWLKKKCVRTSAMVFRREWLLKVGGFDEELRQSHDVDLVLRLSLAGCQTEWLKEETVCYRQHETNTTKNSLKQAIYIQAVLDKFFARDDLPESLTKQERQIRYHTIVWIAWYQYQGGHVDEMAKFLRKSLDYSPYLRVENVSHWLSSFNRFFSERGLEFNVDSLTSSIQWQELVIFTLRLPKTDLSSSVERVKQNNTPTLLPDTDDNVIDRFLEIDLESAKKYQNTGDALLHQGHIKEAVKCYQTAIKIDPELIEVHHKLATFLIELGDLDGVITSCQSILQFDPRDFETIEKLADALFQRGNIGDLSKATEYYEQIVINDPSNLKSYFRIIELKPQKSDIYLKLGYALLDREKIVHAIAVLQIAQQLFPQNQEIYLLLEQAIVLQKNVSNFYNLIEAKSDCIDELGFTSAMSFFRVGEFLKKDKKISEAVICFEKAVALQPDRYKFHHELGNVYREQKQFELAIEQAKQTIKLKPDFVWAYHNMARSLERLNLIDEAIEFYQQALEINPELTVSKNALNKLLNNQNLKEVEQYKKLASEDMKQKRWSEAKENYIKAIAIQANDHKLYHNLGRVLREQGDIEGAIRAAKKTVELKPDFYWGHHNLGRAYEKKGLLKQAIESYQQALTIKPDLEVSEAKIKLLTNKTGI